MSQQSALEYLRHGQTPFFRLPDARPEALPPGTGAALLGVPFDGGTTYQPGARFGPFHVRRVSALVQSWHPGHRLDVFRRLACVDAGNVVFPPFQPAAMREAVQAAVEVVARAAAVPVLVGGDHSIALPALRALARVHGPLAVIHLDAHLDTSGPETWGEPYHHGTPFRNALDEGLVAAGQLHHVGIRGACAPPEEGAAPHGTVHTADEVGDRGAAAVGAALLAAVGRRPVYLSLDVDALDPAFAPGTGTPVPGGLSSREALRLLRALAGVRLAGLDVVEVCPPLDHADLTSHAAAHLLFEGLALAALAPDRGREPAP
ncbi:agmatinase [Anaeromyxobacter paludicola]|uniref:Agmatinase n=1 Tax=Anaeromyxobacter paludicola TaxID=2918171 RepID=A0ABM7X5E1_9BACT|nr:agmatinase [Anaeromyxobacter paludicola]BDG07037.1 agmatinase [Anaeromyxobacter paludicola]